MNLKIFPYFIAPFAVIAAAVFAGDAAEFYVNWLWFLETGFPEVFKTALFSKIASGGAVALVSFGFLYANLVLTKRLLADVIPEFDDDLLKFPGQNHFFTRLHQIAPWLAAFFSYTAGSAFSHFWPQTLAFFKSVPFGSPDPVFGKDISYFIFSLPFYEGLKSGILALSLAAIFISAGSYILSRNIQWSQSRKLWIGKKAQSHLMFLCALFFAAKGWGYYLDRYSCLFSHGKLISGAAYIDVNFIIPSQGMLALICAGFSAVCFVSLFKPIQPFWKIPAAGMALIILVSALGTSIIPGFVQKFRVTPNEIALETPYITSNIRMTRDAFKLDNIHEKPFPAKGGLDSSQLAANRSTIDNVRLWDHRPLIATFGQLQEIRTYYRFSGVDNDRYWIDGNYRQVMLSAREIDSNKLPSRIWINEHLTYTHGYGLVMGFVNESTSEGLPRLLIKDIPPSSYPGLEVKRPEIYYGELDGDYAITNTKSKELDYPSGDENVYSSYAGSGGIRLSGFMRKLAFSMKFGTMKILLSKDITPDSRLLFRRNIIQRASAIAPFLKYDTDPYLVMSRGNLYWIIDGYTTAARYPYSSPSQDGINYIRNSVKVMINAYDGKIAFYISDETDPITKTYARMFPTLFRNISDMPPDIKQHLRYPQDFFALQARMYCRYHMTDPQVFYNQEDLWTFPREILENEDVELEPYYTIMKLPGETKAEYTLMLPLTPSKRDNMIAWMAARSDDPNYGQLVVYRFPKESLIYGPMQIEARINQDSAISQQFTLWGQRGTRIIRGSIMAIPIEDALIYVKPIYLQAEVGKIPELRRVIAACREKIAMDENLESAIKKAVSGFSAAQPGQETMPSLIYSSEAGQALSVYKKAQEKIKRGDWAGYGSDMEELEKILERLKK